MGALAITTVTEEGVTGTYAAMSASDTIDASALGDNGVLLIKGGAGASVVTIADASLTQGGNPAVSDSKSVPATTGHEMFRIRRALQSPTTGLITVTQTAPTGVTYLLLRLP
jgi:hypothetical protein